MISKLTGGLFIRLIEMFLVTFVNPFMIIF
jgi:hypothetical protein